MNTPTPDKIKAIIAAVDEHATVYAAVKKPATPGLYDPMILQGMAAALVQKIQTIMLDK